MTVPLDPPPPKKSEPKLSHRQLKAATGVGFASFFIGQGSRRVHHNDPIKDSPRAADSDPCTPRRSNGRKTLLLSRVCLCFLGTDSSACDNLSSHMNNFGNTGLLLTEGPNKCTNYAVTPHLESGEDCARFVEHARSTWFLQHTDRNTVAPTSDWSHIGSDQLTPQPHAFSMCVVSIAAFGTRWAVYG